MEKINIRSGLLPTETELQYSITTTQAEEYLQAKMNFLIEGMRRAENKKAKEENRKSRADQIKDVKIILSTMRFSKTFMPFVAMMSTNCLKNSSNAKSVEENEIFNPQIQSKGARIQDPIFTFIVKPYGYTKKDEDAFFSNTARSSLGITVKQAHNIKHYRLPKIQKFNKGRVEYVTFLVDPLRLFHDMLGNDNDKNEKFEVFINKESTERIRGLDYKYSVARVVSKNGKKRNKQKEDRIELELERRVTG